MQDVEQQDLRNIRLDKFSIAGSFPAVKTDRSGQCPDNNSIFILFPLFSEYRTTPKIPLQSRQMNGEVSCKFLTSDFYVIHSCGPVHDLHMVP